MFYDILERNKAFLFFKNKRFKKSKNWPFCKGVNQWFWSKNGHFSNFFFLGKIGQENVFYYFLERKNAFLGYKNKKFKKSKNCYFCKGVNAWFWSKNGHFSNFFFLGKRDKEKSFYDILEWKNAFVGYKNKKFKKSKNCQFSKGVKQWFWSKNGYFFKFFLLEQYKAGKFVLRYSRMKNAFLGFKKDSLKRRKIAFFPKGKKRKPMVLVQKWL